MRSVNFFNKSYVSVANFPRFIQNFTLTRCSTLTLHMIPTENKNTIHFKQRLLPNCLLHDLEIVTVNGREITSHYHTPLAVAKFTGKRKKIKSGYFIATPRMYIYIYIRGVTGGTDQTSGGCSLCYTIPI